MSTDKTKATDQSPGMAVPGQTPAPSADSEPLQTADQTTAPAKGYSLYRFIHEPEPPLEDCLDSFWSPATPLEDLPEIPALPEEPYEILKRLGPSPFVGSTFPLIGFLATAYERVRRFARERSGS